MSRSQLASAQAPFTQWMHTAQTQIERILDAQLPASTLAPEQLHAALRYAVLDGGKRIRPLLALAAGELCAAVPMSALHAGCAVELVHAYSLVHDDMPCMDDDVLRRGKPTVHVRYGEATALLVGDALQAQAFASLTQPMAGVGAATALRMVAALASAAGAQGMVGGQQMDLLGENRAEHTALELAALQTLHRKKTGALLQASVTIGALCGYRYDLEPAVKTALVAYSAAVGLGFQIADDVLDATQPSDTLGKTAGKDADANKPTYVSLLGLEGARAEAQALLQKALGALQATGLQAAQLAPLAALAERIVHREH